MITRLLPAALALALAVAAAPPAAAAADSSDSDPSYVGQAVAGWATDPVWVSPDSGALSADQAAALSRRITGWRDDLHVAVLPALALSRMPGSSDFDRALAFVSRVHDRFGADGIFLVSFSGAGTYGGAWGTDEPVGQVVAHQVDTHTLGEVDAILNGILDELQQPAAVEPGSSEDSSSSGTSDDSGLPWAGLLAGLVVLLALAGAGLLLARRRGRLGGRVRGSGETWAGPAAYRPSYPVHPDEQDTVEKRAALAREDVTRLGEELDAADVPVTDPAVAGHVQAALDAYADASRRVDALTTDEELRTLAAVTEYARWQHACAVAVLDQRPLPPRRVRCFVDPAHGTSVADQAWAPPGGVVRPVPVCAACYERMTG